MAKESEKNNQRNNLLAIRKAQQYLKDNFDLEGEVIGWEEEPELIRVAIEAVKSDPYMKKIGIPTPVMERYVYWVVFNKNFQIKEMRREGPKSYLGSRYEN